MRFRTEPRGSGEGTRRFTAPGPASAADADATKVFASTPGRAACLLTSPSFSRCALRCCKRPRANRENQDRPCGEFVKSRHRESTRDAFLRNATERRHSRKSVDVPSFERGTPVSAVERSADFAAGGRFICRFSSNRARTLSCDFAWVDCRTSSCPLPKVVPSFALLQARDGRWRLLGATTSVPRSATRNKRRAGKSRDLLILPRARPSPLSAFTRCPVARSSREIVTLAAG